jgi:branched-chain amino acid transport system substrate-binding protein
MRSTKTTRRSAAALLAAVALVAAACGGTTEDTSSPATPVPTPPPAEDGCPDDRDPIVIGFLTATTGGVAASGLDMVRGWDLFWETNGNVFGCREVRTIHADTASNPDVGLQKARELVEQRGVDLIVGPLLANVGLAVATYASEQGVPLFLPVASADDLTQRDRLPGVIRVGGWTSSQANHVAGDWAYNEGGYRKVITIGTDYAFGHESVGGFTNTFTDAGGEIVSQIWNPLGTTDFSTFMAQIQSAAANGAADAVFALQVGGSSALFLQAWKDFGLGDSLDLIAAETTTDQALIRGVTDGEVLDGVISVGKYAEGFDAPETQAFVEAFDNRYSLIPSYYASTSHVAAEWTAAALDLVDGNIEDLDGFLAAVRSMSFQTAGGPMALDEYDNPIQNVYVRQLQRRDDGRYWNVPLKTYENISQFWTYDIDQFLACPVYSREYQGIGVFPAGC